MKKQQTKTNKTKKIILIMILIIAILVIAILLLNSSKKISNTNEIATKNYTISIGGNEYDISNLVLDAKDITPTLSAGMIPIKWDGEYWQITTQQDNNWCDYSAEKPAYMMLNDGYYRSELEVGVEEKQLAKNNIGTQIHPDSSDLGSIYMWIPRFAYSNKEIIYIKQGCSIDDISGAECYMDLNSFIYETPSMDYSLAGYWAEVTPSTTTSEANAKVAEMNNEDGKYGFLANTVAKLIHDENNSNDWWDYGSFYQYNRRLNNSIFSNDDVDDYNRIVLKIYKAKEVEAIKANAYYDLSDEKIKVEVIYNRNEIVEILYENKTPLEINNENGKITADTTGIEVTLGNRKITLIDSEGNIKQITVVAFKPIYATYYSDGTLGFSNDTSKISGKTVSASYGDISGKTYSGTTIPWYSNISNIKTVNFVNKIYPTSMQYWFYNCTNLTAVNNLGNIDGSSLTSLYQLFHGCTGLTSLNLNALDASKVTDMRGMFYNCSSLTSLNVSSFDTSNVIYMDSMFYNCSSLTSLNVSSFDTSKVISMGSMFARCYNLTTLDLTNFDTSNVISMNSMFAGDHTSSSSIKYMSLTTINIDTNKFDTSKVTDMYCMFSCCNKLTSIDVSKFNTSNVTNMGFMFDICSSLTSLNLTNFDTSKVTNMNAMFQRCSGLTELNLTSFNTAKVTNMNYMFYSCSKLKTITVGSGWTTENASTSSMFTNCGTSKVTEQ